MDSIIDSLKGLDFEKAIVEKLLNVCNYFFDNVNGKSIPIERVNSLLEEFYNNNYNFYSCSEFHTLRDSFDRSLLAYCFMCGVSEPISKFLLQTSPEEITSILVTRTGSGYQQWQYASYYKNWSDDFCKVMEKVISLVYNSGKCPISWITVSSSKTIFHKICKYKNERMFFTMWPYCISQKYIMQSLHEETDKGDTPVLLCLKSGWCNERIYYLLLVNAQVNYFHTDKEGVNILYLYRNSTKENVQMACTLCLKLTPSIPASLAMQKCLNDKKEKGRVYLETDSITLLKDDKGNPNAVRSYAPSACRVVDCTTKIEKTEHFTMINVLMHIRPVEGFLPPMVTALYYTSTEAIVPSFLMFIPWVDILRRTMQHMEQKYEDVLFMNDWEFKELLPSDVDIILIEDEIISERLNKKESTEEAGNDEEKKMSIENFHVIYNRQLSTTALPVSFKPLETCLESMRLQLIEEESKKNESSSNNPSKTVKNLQKEMDKLKMEEENHIIKTTNYIHDLKFTVTLVTKEKTY